MSILIKKAKAVPKEESVKEEVSQVSLEYPGTYHWRKDGEDYYVLYPHNYYARVTPEGNRWRIRLKWDDEFVGTRDTLEESYRDLDGMIYRKNRDLWLKTRGYEIVKDFKEGIDDLLADMASVD